MATIVLSAVGAAAGAAVGGGVFGLSSVVIGRAIGASVGRWVDQKILGAGSSAVETPRVERIRVMGAGEGSPIARVYGRMRIGGHVIWASRFYEHQTTTSGAGAKGGSQGGTDPGGYRYSISLAVALCEGEITRVGRVWADGREVARDKLNMRVYHGTDDQLPDPKIEAVEGVGRSPAFRGTAYVVVEDLELGQFGKRVPQFSFEVFRPAVEGDDGSGGDMAHDIRGVALIPGTGEYALATSPVYFDHGNGDIKAANINSPSQKTDFLTSAEALDQELPNCGSVSLVVSWFADDLRIDRAKLRPKVEQANIDSDDMPWRVGNLDRFSARALPQSQGRSVYGGTPADQSVVEAIRHLKSLGKSVVFYPFILLDQLDGNGLADPWSGDSNQPPLPWRGRMTLSVAPGRNGTPDKTEAAALEIDQFFGTAAVGDFTLNGRDVDYHGPSEWSYRRFILHNAWLCKAAGGVGAFCIGSEMRGLTQIRGASGFPAVAALKTLAADVRAILGPSTKIGYAADWSEYFGYQSPDGNLYFHLDDLWSDDAIDFVGIDNYMPLSDWRDGTDHADASVGSIYNLEYLKGNIEGGEGFDWYYAAPEHRDAQIRTPISDGAYGEDWVWRFKDIRSWWSLEHFERIGGVRNSSPTSWVPQSKPVWFTEIGCAAIDKGTNEPNRFVDPKSSESNLPAYSNGRRDDLIQRQYLRAITQHWSDPQNNPVSGVYGESMIDISRTHVWAWDARPYPFFPNRVGTWSDGGNYFRGHWLNGRASYRGLDSVVAEICADSGVRADVSQLFGIVRGYAVDRDATAREMVQPLALAFGFDCAEKGGQLVFANRGNEQVKSLQRDKVAWPDVQKTPVTKWRNPEAETVGKLDLTYVGDNAGYRLEVQEAIFPDDTSKTTAGTEVPLLLTQTEARVATERWLAEARIAQDRISFSLPPSKSAVGAGDVISFADDPETQFRIERATQGDIQEIEAVRVERSVYEPSDWDDQAVPVRPFAVPSPVLPIFMDLPLLRGDENEAAPHLAVAATPWPGAVSVYSSLTDANYRLNSVVTSPSIVGTLETPLDSAACDLPDRGDAVRVRIGAGALSSISDDELLSGFNLAAVGDGTPSNWEIIQFRDATLVSKGVYDLTHRLRGKAGSDALSSRHWPTGSRFVLLNGAAQQIQAASADRTLEHYYRIGPSGQSYDDPAFRTSRLAFEGIGLRPLAPAHLKAEKSATGDIAVSWIRRTRIEGDNWQSFEVPLGEETESYLLEIVANGSVLRSEILPQTGFTYTTADQTADGVGANFAIQVAQISNRFGPGLFRRIFVDV